MTVCSSSDAAQWRAGPSSTLVNLASGACLTGGTTINADIQATPCSGALTQRWALP